MKVVGTARNGAEGLEKIAKYKPDFAIVDIKMPVMNGIEMIRKAKEQYPDMTFVVLPAWPVLLLPAAALPAPPLLLLLLHPASHLPLTAM